MFPQVDRTRSRTATDDGEIVEVKHIKHIFHLLCYISTPEFFRVTRIEKKVFKKPQAGSPVKYMSIT